MDRDSKKEKERQRQREEELRMAGFAVPRQGALLKVAQAADSRELIEFKPGTAVLYGSQVGLRCSQGGYLGVDGYGSALVREASPEGKPAKGAPHLRILKADNLSNQQQVRFGDSIFIAVSENELLGAKLRPTKDGSAYAPAVIDMIKANAQDRTDKRSSLMSRWTITHPVHGHSKKVVGKVVGHLDTIRLEMEWQTLCAVGSPDVMTELNG